MIQSKKHEKSENKIYVIIHKTTQNLLISHNLIQL